MQQFEKLKNFFYNIYITKNKRRNNMNSRVFNCFESMNVGDLIRILEAYKEYNIQICENDGLIIKEIDNSILA